MKDVKIFLLADVLSEREYIVGTIKSQIETEDDEIFEVELLGKVCPDDAPTVMQIKASWICKMFAIDGQINTISFRD